MKLATYRHETGEERLGLISNDEVIEVASLDSSLPTTMIDLLRSGKDGLAAVRSAINGNGNRLPLAQVTLMAPVPRPSKYLALGANYSKHLEEFSKSHPRANIPSTKQQHWFNKQVSCIVGPYDPMHLPRVSADLDYEGELGLVIGTRCRHVPPERAHEMIAGYVVCNDVSVRDWQSLSPTATMGKSFDTHGPIGPWLTTADEVADPNILRVRTWIDDDLRQDGNTSEFIHKIPQMIAFLTTAFTLEPGDILSTGTPAGVGGAQVPPRYLKAGQRCRIEIEGLGEIDNLVIDEPQSTRLP
ncbi:MAG TPA: fumarylacetoacetate hydrolase family protein [Steroidobacteraceae bacterium]|nr:fumarylacetoacetate hydrolase family protein [Steroidobacteraceae bacterium]